MPSFTALCVVCLALPTVLSMQLSPQGDKRDATPAKQAAKEAAPIRFEVSLINAGEVSDAAKETKTSKKAKTAVNKASKNAKADKLVLEKGSYLVHEIIEKTGAFLGRSYLFDMSQNPAVCNPNDDKVKIKLPRTVSLDRNGAEEYVGALLRSRGWVAVALDYDRDLYEWIYLKGPKSRSIRTHARHLPAEEILARPKIVDFVMTTITPKHVNAQMMSANLARVFNDQQGFAAIMPLGDQLDQRQYANNSYTSRSLVLTGFRPEVAEFVAMIQAADKRLAASVKETETRLGQRLQRIESRLNGLERAGKGRGPTVPGPGGPTKPGRKK